MAYLRAPTTGELYQNHQRDLGDEVNEGIGQAVRAIRHSGPQLKVERIEVRYIDGEAIEIVEGEVWRSARVTTQPYVIGISGKPTGEGDESPHLICLEKFLEEANPGETPLDSSTITNNLFAVPFSRIEGYRLLPNV